MKSSGRKKTCPALMIQMSTQTAIPMASARMAGFCRGPRRRNVE
jgi:hypothetical protein